MALARRLLFSARSNVMAMQQLGLTLRRMTPDGTRRYTRSDRPLAAEHEMQASWVGPLSALIAPPGRASPHGVVWWSVDIADARNAVVGALRKRRGVISAIPDMVFHWPQGNVGYIEAKTATGALSRSGVVRRKRGGNVRLLDVLGQDELHANLDAAGVRVAVARSFEELLDTLRGWGVPMRDAARHGGA